MDQKITPPPAALSLEFINDRLRESNQELRELKHSVRYEVALPLSSIAQSLKEIARSLVVLVMRP
jgi:hypothetical protein